MPEPVQSRNLWYGYVPGGLDMAELGIDRGILQTRRRRQPCLLGSIQHLALCRRQ